MYSLAQAQSSQSLRTGISSSDRLARRAMGAARASEIAVAGGGDEDSEKDCGMMAQRSRGNRWDSSRGSLAFDAPGPLPGSHGRFEVDKSRGEGYSAMPDGGMKCSDDP